MPAKKSPKSPKKSPNKTPKAKRTVVVRDRDLPRRRSSPKKQPIPKKTPARRYKSPIPKEARFTMYVDSPFRTPPSVRTRISLPPSRLFSAYKLMVPGADKTDYYDSRTGWDIDGLREDMKLVLN